MMVVRVMSALLSNVQFTGLDPRNGQPIRIENLLEGASLTGFMAKRVRTFVDFPPPAAAARRYRRAAFAGLSDGFSATCYVSSSPDQLLAGLTQTAYPGGDSTTNIISPC